jgi:hypothetical protein
MQYLWCFVVLFNYELTFLWSLNVFNVFVNVFAPATNCCYVHFLSHFRQGGWLLQRKHRLNQNNWGSCRYHCACIFKHNEYHQEMKTKDESSQRLYSCIWLFVLCWSSKSMSSVFTRWLTHDAKDSKRWRSAYLVLFMQAIQTVVRFVHSPTWLYCLSVNWMYC